MFTNKRLVNSLVKKIGQVELETLNALREGRVEQEPALTDSAIADLVGWVKERNPTSILLLVIFICWVSFYSTFSIDRNDLKF